MNSSPNSAAAWVWTSLVPWARPSGAMILNNHDVGQNNSHLTLQATTTDLPTFTNSQVDISPKATGVVEKTTVWLSGHNQERVFVQISRHALRNEVPLLVFLQGCNASSALWSAQIAYFEQVANVAAVDWPGQGLSDQCLVSNESLSVSALCALLEKVYALCESSHIVMIVDGYAASLVVACLPLFSRPIHGVVTFNYGDSPPLRAIIKSTQTTLSSWLPLLVNPSYVNAPSLKPEASALQRLMTLPVLLIRGERNLQSGYDLWEQIAAEKEGDHVSIIRGDGSRLMETESTVVNALISQFLIKEVGLVKMDLNYQLQRQAELDGAKWNLKNFEKWSRTDAIGSRVQGTMFRPMKVMRQTDLTHSPSACMLNNPLIGVVIDLSSGPPPYLTTDPAIQQYIKLPAVSKTVPSVIEVAAFIRTVKEYSFSHPDQEIAVHCHYGFNRTGFMICCYCIEELGVAVPDAINRFAESRPPGIKHQHFKDELHLRYLVPKIAISCSPSRHSWSFADASGSSALFASRNSL